MSRSAKTRISLRPETKRDLTVVFQIFEESRPDIRGATHLAKAVKDELMEMQFRAQSTHYKTKFPTADYGIIEFDGAVAGRCYLNRTDSEILIIDLAILEKFRNQGIASNILRAIIEEARLTGRKVRLHVEKQNLAKGMYEQHGFEVIGENRCIGKCNGLSSKGALQRRTRRLRIVNVKFRCSISDSNFSQNNTNPSMGSRFLH